MTTQESDLPAGQRREGRLLVVPRPALESPTPLFHGSPALFVQTTGQIDERATRVAQACAASGMGAVHTVKFGDNSRSRRKRVGKLVTVHTGHGLNPKTLLFDAARYHGKMRRIGSEHDLSQEWVDQQAEVGCRALLTDSGYVPDGDARSLEMTLEQAKDLDGDLVVAVLALGGRWFKEDSHKLVEMITAADMPVALIAEADYDPFEDKKAVEGLIHVVNAPVKVLNLRSDQSGVGAVAFGASACGVGITTATRHLSPIKSGFVPMKNHDGPQVAVYVEQAMSYRSTIKIAEAAGLTPDHPQWWDCHETCCNGNPITLIATEDEAFVHSLTVLAAQAGSVLGHQDVQQRRHSWITLCQNGQMMNLEIHDVRGMRGWREPGFLAGWVQAFGADKL